MNWDIYLVSDVSSGPVSSREWQPICFPAILIELEALMCLHTTPGSWLPFGLIHSESNSYNEAMKDISALHEARQVAFALLDLSASHTMGLICSANGRK